MRALNLPRRDKVDDHRLRRVEYPGQAADGETPADRQGGAVQVVKPPGIPGEEPLVGGVEAVQQERNPHLSPVGVAGDNKIKAAALVELRQLRPVAEEDGERPLLQPRPAGLPLFQPPHPRQRSGWSGPGP